MTKADILSQIKKAEEDAKSMISSANEARSKKIQEAKTKARELISNAEIESAEKGEKKIAQAKEQINSEKEKMLKAGIADAQAIKSAATEKITKATEYLVEQFERIIYA